MNRRQTARLAGVFLLASCACLASATTVAAGRGVAVDLREMTVTDDLEPGRTYILPTLTIRNPGDEAGPYRMSAAGVENDDFLDPGADWFLFGPGAFRLEPGDAQAVSIEIRVPADAAPGTYFGLVRGEAVPEGAGTLFGAAAAATLTFTVVPVQADANFFGWLLDTFGGLAPWSYVIPIASLILVLAVVVIRRRFTIHIETRG